MSATPGGDGVPGGDSYALVSQDYANVSIKFGYHYCNVDSLCGNDPIQNYVTMQFAGGVGSYYGKVLRVEFLSKVLTQLGFVVTANGDSISASLKGLDLRAQSEALDQLGRLLAASRLLDVGIRSQQDIERMMKAFFRSEYDFMNLDRAYDLPGFYAPEGDWECRSDKDGAWLVQDGSKWAGRFSQALARRMNRMVGTRYQQFLDNIQAYFYFPLAIAKAGYLSTGSVRAAVKPMGGLIDQAGGIAFGIQNIGNYFVFRLNSLEDNLVLFEYVNSRRIERKSTPYKLASDQWYHLRINLEERHLTAFLNDEPVLSYEADRNLAGYVGLWTKADSLTAFDHFHISTSTSLVDLFADLRRADFLRRMG
jgi:pyruvate,water dikinase